MDLVPSHQCLQYRIYQFQYSVLWVRGSLFRMCQNYNLYVLCVALLAMGLTSAMAEPDASRTETGTVITCLCYGDRLI
jgi:aryl-alcohol dehydrogenase-like predicted oxidoreductase